MEEKNKEGPDTSARSAEKGLPTSAGKPSKIPRLKSLIIYKQRVPLAERFPALAATLKAAKPKPKDENEKLEMEKCESSFKILNLEE